MEWVCDICGYVHDDEEPPNNCPICGAPSSKFSAYDEDERFGNDEPLEWEDDDDYDEEED